MTKRIIQGNTRDTLDSPAFKAFLDCVRSYLINTHGFSADDAASYVEDREKFTTPWRLGWTASKTVDLDFGSFESGDSENGDGRFA